MSKTGTPLYKQGDPWWFYWLDGKQWHCSGEVAAKSERAAKRMIRERHPGAIIDTVMSHQEYCGMKLGL